ncbi:MAG: FAD-dependent oxidoreductase [Nocardioides sp.]|uniref:FAD-dependent oxidoreductase n=1 Tax=Nocardioides sp. TaxID=35761 RepID=UPI0039E6DDC0
MIRVRGAGIIGLTVADELLRRGHRVEVVDPDPGRGASYAAAGMLSPAGELWYGESDLLRLGRRSARLWPALAARLGVELRRGTLLAAVDHADLQALERQLDLVARHGERPLPLTRRELLGHEPRLGRVSGGALLPEDHSVDPRAVLAALRRRIPVVSAPSETAAEATVWAVGTRPPAAYRSLVRGVRGEILRLRVGADDLPDRTLRGWVAGEQVYLVPRAGGELVLGATSGEYDAGPVVTVEGVARLLDSARRLMPGLDRAELVEATARDRPGTADNLPLVGPGREGEVLAVGHFRHGVLLAPLTARLVADHLETGYVEAALDPRRFPAVPVAGAGAARHDEGER